MINNSFDISRFNNNAPSKLQNVEGLLQGAIKDRDCEQAVHLFKLSDKEEWPRMAPTLNGLIDLLLRNDRVALALEISLAMEGQNAPVFPYTSEQLLCALAKSKDFQSMNLLFFKLVTQSKLLAKHAVETMKQALEGGSAEDKKQFEILMQLTQMQSPQMRWNKQLLYWQYEGNLSQMEKVFQQMKTPDKTALSLLIAACCEKNELDKALAYYHLMRNKGFSCGWEIGYHLMELCEYKREERLAIEVYQTLPSHDMIHNIAIRCLLITGRTDEAYALYLRHREALEGITYWFLIKYLPPAEARLVDREFSKQLLIFN